jgi:cytoskeletal protein RodZ
MALNVLLESVIGVIPILGDLFDFVFKANQRNVNLMRKYVLNPRDTTRQSLLTLIFLLVFFIVVLGFMVWGMFALVAALMHAF